MDDLSRRDLLKRTAAAGAGAVIIPGLAACGSKSSGGAGTSTQPGSSPPAKLTGRLVRPEDRGYERARTDWDGLFSHYPLVIVFCQNTQDVVNAITWSRQNDVALRARSGRHNLEGWSNVDGGIVIDVSEIKGVHIDASARTATVGAGLNQGEIVPALGRKGFAVPTGSEGTVGVAGATLGGGFGLLTRSMGLSCDNLIGMEMVVPSGSNGAKAIKVDQHNNSDLLWACRGGGGGNFGIATSFTYSLHPLSTVSLVTAKWGDFKDLNAVFDAWQRHAPTADQRLTSVLEVGPGSILLVGVLASGSAAEARRMLQPLLGIGKPQVKVQTLPWPKVFAGFNTGTGPAQFANWKFFSQFISKPFPPEAIQIVRKYMTKAPSSPSNFFCSSFGGAVRHEPPGGSAFPHRDAIFYAEPGAGWNGDALTSKSQAWVAEFSQALRPYVNGAYVNVPNAGMADWETAYYGSNYARLRQVKATYDPDNVFQFDQSIPPASS